MLFSQSKPDLREGERKAFGSSGISSYGVIAHPSQQKVTYYYESFGIVYVDPSSLCSEVLLRSLRYAKLRLRLRFAQDDTRGVRNSLTLIAEGIKLKKVGT